MDEEANTRYCLTHCLYKNNVKHQKNMLFTINRTKYLFAIYLFICFIVPNLLPVTAVKFTIHLIRYEI